MTSNPINLNNGEAPEAESKERKDLLKQFARLPMGLFLDLQDDRLSYRDVSVYCYLLAKANEEQVLWWGLEHLSEMTGVDERCLKESIAKLTTCGHIQRNRRMGTSSTTVCRTYVKNEGLDTIIVCKGKEVARYLKGATKSRAAPTVARNTIVANPSAYRSHDRESKSEVTLLN